MDVIVAATKTKELLKKECKKNLPKPRRCPEFANGMPHTLWMLEGIEKEYIQDEKAHRWLSWAQSSIYNYYDDIHLDAFKTINKES